MHIAKVNIEGVPPLVGEALFDCDARVNLLVGPNATGKSTILRAINGLNLSVLDWTGDNFVIIFPNALNEGAEGFCFLWPSENWPRDNQGDIVDNVLPFVYIPATRVNLPGRDLFSRNQLLDYVNTEGAPSPVDSLFESDSGIFYGRYVELAINQLREEMAQSLPAPIDRTTGWTLEDTNFNRRKQGQLRRVLEVGYSCAKTVCQEVIYDNGPHSYVDNINDDKKFVRYGMGSEQLTTFSANHFTPVL